MAYTPVLSGSVDRKIANAINYAGAGVDGAATTSALAAVEAAAGKKVAAPASAGAPGVAGTWATDTGFIYVCTATNTWKRVAIATW